MSYFPLFIDLKGKKCIIIGDGPVARRKADSLRMFEGDVSIYSEGEWDEEVLFKAFLVIAATDQRAVNRGIAKFCKEQEIFVNVADSKEESTFLFPSVIKRGDLSIGISTQGSSPVVASDIRRMIEAVLPMEIADIIAFMKEIREDIKGLSMPKKIRRDIFRTLYKEAKDKHRRLEKEEVHSVIAELSGEKNDHVSKK